MIRQTPRPLGLRKFSSNRRKNFNAFTVNNIKTARSWSLHVSQPFHDLVLVSPYPNVDKQCSYKETLQH